MTYRNKRLLQAVKDCPCCSCGTHDGTVVAAHSNQLRDGKGRGTKAADYRIAALCHRCHSELDQGMRLSREQRIELWEEAHRRTVAWLFESGTVDVVRGG